MVLAAPQVYGGNHPTVTRALAITAAAIAVVLPAPLRIRRSGPLVPIGLAVIAIGVLQLVPLPASVVGAISPRALAIRELALGPDLALRPQCLSLAPARTALTIEHLATAVLVCALVAELARIDRYARTIALALVGIGAFEASYALATYYTTGPNVWGHPVMRGRLCGTYVNPNHFAGLLAIVLPLSLVPVTGVSVAPRGVRPSWTLALVRWVDRPGRAQSVLMHGGAVLMVLAVLLSLSRAAIATVVATLVLMAAASSRISRISVGRAIALGLTAGVVVVTFAGFGTDALVRRVDELDQGVTDRVAICDEAARLCVAFPGLGCGLGAFEPVHPAYERTPRFGIRTNSAHCEFLELACEAGIPIALAALAGALLALVRQVRLALDARRPSDARRWDLALAGAWLAVMARAAVDFDFRSSGNAVAAAAVAGLMAARRGEVRERARNHTRPMLLVVFGLLALTTQLLRPTEAAQKRVDQAELAFASARASARIDAQLLVDDLGGDDTSMGLRAAVAGLAIERSRTELDRVVRDLLDAYAFAVVQEPSQPRTHAKLSYGASVLARQGDSAAAAVALRHATAARTLMPGGERWHTFARVAELAIDPGGEPPLYAIRRLVACRPELFELVTHLAAPLGLAERIAHGVPHGEAREWRTFAATSLALGDLRGAVAALDRLAAAAKLSAVARGSSILRFEGRVQGRVEAAVACVRIGDRHAGHLMLGLSWSSHEVETDHRGELALHEATRWYQLGATPPACHVEVRDVRWADR